MRRVIKLFIYISLIICFFLYIFPYATLINRLSSYFIETSSLIKNIKSSKTYIFDKEEKYLEFSIPTFSNKVKFIVTANLNNTQIIKKNLNIRYTLEYEIIGADNKVLATKIHHFRTSYGISCDTNKKQVNNKFYKSTLLEPTSMRVLLISLHKYANVSKVKIKVKNKENIISDIAIQSYYFENIPENKHKQVWNRMQKETKEFVSRGNLYGLDFLSEEEEILLVSGAWKPIGPNGVTGHDYTTRTLYILEDQDDIFPCTEIKVDMHTDLNLYMSRYLNAGKYSLKFIKDETNATSTLNINYYVGSKTEYSKKYLFNGKTLNVELNTSEDGIIKIDNNVSTSIYINDSNKSTPLETKIGLSMDYYLLDSNSSMKYEFYSNIDRLIKLESRSSNLSSSNLSIKMRDKSGKLLRIIKEKIFYSFSNYDYTSPYITQSDPDYIYFTLPKEGHSIELFSDENMIVKLSSRSSKAVYPIYTTAYYKNLEYVKMPSWFSIRPYNFNTQEIKGKIANIYKQPRHQEVSDYIQSGNFNFEQLLPKDRWQGHELFLQRPLNNSFIRSQSWNNIYTPLATGEETTITLKTDVGISEKKATIHYQKKQKYMNDKDLNEYTSIYINNVGIYYKPFFVDSGNIIIPSLSSKSKHKIKFKNAYKYDFFISNVSSNSQKYIKKMFLTFNKPLKFIVEKKSDEESIGIQFASERLQSTAVKFKLTFDKIPLSKGVYKSLTFQNYEINVAQDKDKMQTLLIGNKTLYVIDSAYVTLGESLAKGKYIMTIHPPKNKIKNYIYVNHIIPYAAAKIRMSRENQ